ncbi:MAG: hypothetical protein WC743_11475 [Mucilaginibacter sp.]
MRNLETKRLTRNEMKSVLGGIGRKCQIDSDCPPGQYCESGANRDQCAVKEVDPFRLAAATVIKK